MSGVESFPCPIRGGWCIFGRCPNYGIIRRAAEELGKGVVGMERSLGRGGYEEAVEAFARAYEEAEH